MSEANSGLVADPLFVGATRPPMRWGVTYSALLFNMVFTMEAFLVTKNLLTLLLAAPIHGISLLLCARDAGSSICCCSVDGRACPRYSRISGSGRQAAIHRSR